MTFAVTAHTSVTGPSNQLLAFGDLAVGDFAEVNGQDSGSGVVAVRIDLEDLGDDSGGEVELRGGEVEGSRDANGILVAHEVKLEDESGGDDHGGGGDSGGGD